MFRFCHSQGVGGDPHTTLALLPDSKIAKKKAEDLSSQILDSDEMTIRIGRAGPHSGKPTFIYPHLLFLCLISAIKKVLHESLHLNKLGSNHLATVNKINSLALIIAKMYAEWLRKPNKLL